jgi:hypothetical protein
LGEVKPHQWNIRNLRYGSLADIEIVITDVCFASKSGHVHNQNELHALKVRAP